MANVHCLGHTGRKMAASHRDLRCASALRKIGNNPQRSLAFELNLQRLVSDASYTPPRQIGPVEVQQLPGRGRGVVAKENVGPGSLLFVSEAIGSVLHDQLGQQLQPQHLMQHWQTSQGTSLSAADRYKLSLLHNPNTPASSAQQISFKDFSGSKATTKAKKATAKGFGAAAATGGSKPATATAAVELSDEQLQEVLAGNAYGDDHVDGALAWCRKQQQHSIIGVWPEFSLLNHSCAPNTVAPVLLPDRLLLRTAVSVPAGTELTTSYFGLAGGIPRQQRQQLLQQYYGFVCTCPRCKAEEQAPEAAVSTLQAMHEWSSQVEPTHLMQLMAANDAAAIQELHDKAAGFVQQLEQELSGITEQLLVHWLRASAYGTYALLLRTREFLTVVKDVNAPQQLAELVRVFAPASEPHLLLLSDSAIRAAEASSGPTTPEESSELRVHQLVRAAALRYGPAPDVDVLSQLASSITASLNPHWLGLIDLNGTLGLQQLMEAAAARSGGNCGAVAAAADDAVEGKRKVELDLKQLGMLSQSE